jgi:hypothetical protein
MAVVITCEHCKGKRSVPPSRIREGIRFCSWACYSAATRISREDLFWSRTDRRGPDECWPWTGVATSHGYGVMVINGKRTIATRYSWSLANDRPWPAGRIACHHCDNPICVNPRHIYAGTHSDNSTDSVVRGRTSGQKKTHCKNGHELTEQNVWRYGNMRVCKQCQYARARRSYHRRRMATS